MDSDNDFKIRKALVWKTCNSLDRIWRSELNNNLKLRLLKWVVEPILLYGAETWTVTAQQQQRLGENYTNFLRRVQNIHWSSHSTLQEIYKDLPKISTMVTERRLTFAGHCYRAKEEAVSRLIM